MGGGSDRCNEAGGCCTAGVTVLSWDDGALRRSQIHDAFDSVAIRAVLLPGAGADADVETVVWWVEKAWWTWLVTNDGTSTAPRDGVQPLPGDEVQPDDVNSMTLTGVDLAYLEIASPSMMMDPSTLSAATEMQLGLALSPQCPC